MGVSSGTLGKRSFRSAAIGRVGSKVTTYEAAFELPPAVDSIARARAIVRSLDPDLGLREDVVGDAELLVSEVVTNAIRHGGPLIRLNVTVDGRGLEVRVYDGARTMPVPRHPDVDVPNGRGLQIVESVATSWGIVMEATGKTVWFRINHRLIRH